MKLKSKIFNYVIFIYCLIVVKMLYSILKIGILTKQFEYFENFHTHFDNVLIFLPRNIHQLVILLYKFS